MKLLNSFAVAIPLVLLGCEIPPASHPVAPVAGVSHRLTGSWQLLTVDQKSVVPQVSIVRFDDGGEYVATVACNEIHGRYTSDETTISLVGPLRQTEKACGSAPPNEALLLRVLSGEGGPWTITFEGIGDLVLSGQHRLRLSKSR